MERPVFCVCARENVTKAVSDRLLRGWLLPLLPRAATQTTLRSVRMPGGASREHLEAANHRASRGNSTERGLGKGHLEERARPAASGPLTEDNVAGRVSGGRSS